MSCTSDCVDEGKDYLKNTIEDILKSVYNPIGGTAIALRLKTALDTALCKLPKDWYNTIITISTDTLSQSNKAYIVVIFVTLLILMIFNYISQLLQSQTATGIFFFVSILVILIAVIILYIWITSIYNNAKTQN